MTTSVFLDTLRQHDLEQFYPTFSTHGINHLQSLAQLSVQDYAQLGITDIADRRKIFGLIQLLRKDPNPRLNTASMVTSASTMTTGLRRPQSYNTTSRPTIVTNNHGNNTMDSSTVTSPLSPLYSNNNSNNTSRLPQPNSTSPLDTNSGNNIASSRISRHRRPSVINNNPTPNKSTLPLPSNTNLNSNISPRPIRQRTMSDASRLDMSCLPSRPTGIATRDHRQRADLRRSLYLDQDDSVKSILSGLNNSSDDDDDDEEDNARRYRTSAPLLNAYGMPTMKSRASMGALKYSSTSSPSTPTNTTMNSSSSAAAASSTSANASFLALPASDLYQKIRVCVRKRPLNRKELEKGEKDISPCIGTRSLHINEPKLRLDMSRYIEQHSFTFDDVFDLDTSNSKVYERTALPLVKYIFEGGKATCFAYGQTGSGKTFTMLDPKHGLYIMAAKDIFSILRKPENQHLSAWIGLYEIYQGQLYDLLNNRKKLFAREDGKQNVIISGLKEYPIDNVDKLIQVFDYGNQVRSTGSTGANDSSSRSHAVLQVLLKPKKNKKKIHGKLSFIDLAGSERGADRGEADTKTRMEGAEINKSLLALKECIRALDQDKRHTPFRQSKLTQVLKDSFVGNSRTCMIATISPSGGNSEHTLNTLRYADRVKELKGERERRATMERSGSSGSNGATDMDRSLNYDDDDDEDENYTHDDYFGDGDSQEDSDILDEDTYNVGEENIFDVDFPHEQDELIRSNAFATATQKPIPQYTLPAPTMPPSYTMRRDSSSSVSRYNKQDEANETPSPTGTKPERWSQPSILPPKPYSSTNPKFMSRSSSGMVLGDGGSSTTSTIQRSPSLTMDPYDTAPPSPQQQQQQQQQRRMPVSPTSITTPTSSTRFSFSSSSSAAQPTSTGGNGTAALQLDYKDMEDFVKLHRAEIRSVTEYTKRESKLVATMSLQLSSNQDTSDDDNKDNQHDDETGGNGKKLRDLTGQSNQQFRSYLYSLDELLEEKMASIAALRDRINDTMTMMDA
ncbi:P-loop containing nucleoside triphosphate hydrolase protein [Halteromyces radiatus]|uniref:P-loop containing nucleoside triphosphate hydrolase protein n=1 Tax=Halteromyces radiatus TaxID=101107 RepID=UPI00221F7AC1|nr:P-loop containing nucleoside triphosphate hydrolase protein [Halteromyces radiatus]KAI8089224.1 P-loop containing nucleoside triphosphate hydrolase protein [Halteromyces radiatus]